MFPESVEPVNPQAQATIEQFSNRYHDAVEYLERRKYSAARGEYLELLRLYQQILDYDLDPLHANIAYSCIEDLYNDLQHKVEQPVISQNGFRMWLGTSLLLILLGIFVIANPSYVGLVTLEPQPFVKAYWHGPVELVIADTTTLNLDDYVVSEAPVTYLVSQGEGVQVLQDRNLITLLPFDNGFSRITVYVYAEDQFLFEQQLLIKVY